MSDGFRSIIGFRAFLWIGIGLLLSRLGCTRVMEIASRIYRGHEWSCVADLDAWVQCWYDCGAWKESQGSDPEGRSTGFRDLNAHRYLVMYGQTKAFGHETRRVGTFPGILVPFWLGRNTSHRVVVIVPNLTTIRRSLGPLDVNVEGRFSFL
jgi:hypothetical protein